MDHCLGISLTRPGIFQEVKEAKEVKHEGKEGENATKQEAHQEKAVHAAEHDAYAEVVEKGMLQCLALASSQHPLIANPLAARAGHHADSPKHDGGDTYQGRPEYKDEPALTAEDALMYADQQQPDWEPYGDNEAVGDMRNKDFDEVRDYLHPRPQNARAVSAEFGVGGRAGIQALS